MHKIEHSYQNDCSTSTLNYSNDEYGQSNSPNGSNNDGDTQASSPVDCSILNLANKINHDDNTYLTPASTENSNQSDESSSLLNYPNGNANSFYVNHNGNHHFDEFSNGII